MEKNMTFYILIMGLVLSWWRLLKKLISWLDLGLSKGQFGSGLCPTWNQPVGIGWKKKAPTGVIRSGGLEHQRVAGGSVEFGTTRKRWKKHSSDKNLTGFDEISLDPVKISLDLREIAWESGKISSESGFFRWILENFGRNLEIFQSIRVFQFLREENQNPTCRKWFLVMKTCRRPPEVVGSTDFKSDPIDSSGGSSTRMNLDSPNLTHEWCNLQRSHEEHMPEAEESSGKLYFVSHFATLAKSWVTHDTLCLEYF